MEVNVNVTRVLGAKVGEVEVKVQLAITPQLKEVSVVIDKASFLIPEAKGPR